VNVRSRRLIVLFNSRAPAAVEHDEFDPIKRHVFVRINRTTFSHVRLTRESATRIITALYRDRDKFDSYTQTLPARPFIQSRRPGRAYRRRKYRHRYGRSITDAR